MQLVETFQSNVRDCKSELKIKIQRYNQIGSKRKKKKIYNANSNQKRARVALLISDKMDIKTKIATREK